MLQRYSSRPVYSIIKRFMDVVISLAILIVGLPVWLIVALLIKLEDGGPIFFTQLRAGLHGRPFRIYKFRSMVVGADKKLEQLVDINRVSEPVIKIPDDPRVTRIGRFLRKTGLDEVPQFFNVLTGTMNVVGPRPEQVELVRRYNPHQRCRLRIKPGITGYQQVMSRGDLSLSKRIQYDLYYMSHQNLFLDLYIMAKTFLVLIRGDGIS